MCSSGILGVMNAKVLSLFVLLLTLIIIGMFIFAYLTQQSAG
jgi:hypothetical protein